MTPTSFTAVKDRGQLAVLRPRDRSTPVEMRLTSPLVAALASAEESRPQLQAFLFHPGDRPPPSAALRTSFVRGFSQFISEQFRPYLAGLAQVATHAPPAP